MRKVAFSYQKTSHNGYVLSLVQRKASQNVVVLSRFGTPDQTEEREDCTEHKAEPSFESGQHETCGLRAMDSICVFNKMVLVIPAEELCVRARAVRPYELDNSQTRFARNFFISCLSKPSNRRQSSSNFTAFALVSEFEVRDRFET